MPEADTGPRIAGGANGFKLVGIVLGLAVQSRALGYAMGAYGAGISVYSNFIARGHEVVFPKNTLMEIGIGRRRQAENRENSWFRLRRPTHQGSRRN